MKKWVEKSLAGNEITSCASPYDACISARRIFWDKKNRPENLEKPKRKECLWKMNRFTTTVLRCLDLKVKQKHCPLLQSVGSLSGDVFPMLEFRIMKITNNHQIQEDRSGNDFCSSEAKIPAPCKMTGFRNSGVFVSGNLRSQNGSKLQGFGGCSKIFGGKAVFLVGGRWHSENSSWANLIETQPRRFINPHIWVSYLDTWMS